MEYVRNALYVPENPSSCEKICYRAFRLYKTKYRAAYSTQYTKIQKKIYISKQN